MTKNPFQTSSQQIAPIILPSPQFMTVDVIRREGKKSRSNIAEKIGYSPSKITAVVNDLIQNEILIETEISNYTGGRRGRLIDFNPDFGYFLVATVNRSKLDIALVDFAENIRIRRMLPIATDNNPVSILQDLDRFAQQRLEKLNIPIERLYGIGLSVPTPINSETGLLYPTPELVGWQDLQIESFLREIFPYAIVCIEKDANAIAFEEYRQRRRDGEVEQHFIYAHLDQSIRVSMLLDGKIFSGAHGRSGDIGRMTIPVNEGSKELDDMIALLNGADSDDISPQLIEDVGQHVGHALALLVGVFDPEVIMLGGVIANKFGAPFLTSVRRSILDFSRSTTSMNLNIELANPGADIQTKGIIALTASQIFVAE